MAKLKVMTLDNLTLYDELIKSYVDTTDAKSLKTVAIDGNTLKFYKIEEPVGETIPAYEITLPETDISGLLSKLTGATENNVVTVGTDGTVKDSGIALVDLATKTEVATVSDIANLNKTDIGTMKGQIAALESGTYDDSELRELIADKADASNTLAGYGITDAYTKTETDTAITTAIANAEHLKRSIVDALPEVASADIHTIYMVEKTNGSGDQQYDEYMLINDVFEKIGDSSVNLTDYATKAEVTTAVDTLANGQVAINTTNIEALQTLVGDGVEPVSTADINALFS